MLVGCIRQTSSSTGSLPVFTTAHSPGLPEMNPEDGQRYLDVLDTWVAEHPFLDGGTSASSAVFDAAISAKALRDSKTSDLALQRELNRGAAANPFLSEFYRDDEDESGASFVPTEYLGIFYASLRAGLSLGDTAVSLLKDRRMLRKKTRELKWKSPFSGAARTIRVYSGLTPNRPDALSWWPC